MQTNLQPQPQPLTEKKHLHDIEIENHLERPSDFIEVAKRKNAKIRRPQSSRVVVVFNHHTVGFSARGNKPYPREYRHLLVKAFMAAGLLGLFLIITVN